MPQWPTWIAAAWIIALMGGQLGLALYYGEQWPVVVWTVACIVVGVAAGEWRFSRWWRQATRRDDL